MNIANGHGKHVAVAAQVVSTVPHMNVPSEELTDEDRELIEYAREIVDEPICTF